MKKIITSCLLGASLLFGANAASAQHFNFGVKAGGNYGFGNMKYTSLGYTGKMNHSGIGLYIGAFTEISGDSKLRGQIELLYDYNTLKFNNESFRLGALRVPILAKYAITPKLNVSIGPSLGFNLTRKSIYKHSNVIIDRKDEIKSFQFGALVGVSYSITESLGVDLRYNQYFSNLYIGEGIHDEKFKYNVLQLGLSFKF